MRLKALLIVLLVVLPALARGQATGGADVQLSDLRASGEPLVESSTKVSATIVNPSTIDAVVDVRATFGDGTTANPHDTLGFQVRVPANGKKVVDLSIFSPASKRGEQKLTVKVESARDPRPEDNVRTITWFVRDPKLRVVAEVEGTPSAPVAGVGYIRYKVSNEGNVADTPAYTAVVKPPWTAEVKSPAGAIEPGQTAEVLVLLRPNSEDPAVTTDVEFAARSSHTKAVTVTAFIERVEANASQLRAAHRTAIEGLPASIQVLEGEAFRVPFVVANRGATPDVIEVAIVPPANATAWAAHFLQNGRASTKVLAGLEPTRTMNLTLVVTRLAAGATNGTLDVLAGSLNADLFGASGGEVNVTRRVVVSRAEPVVEIAGLDVPGFVYRGERVTARLDLRNLGRLGAESVSIRWELRELGRVVDASSETIELPTGGGQSSWAFAMDRLEGEYLVSAQIGAGVRIEGPSKASKTFLLHLPRLELLAPQRIEVDPNTRLNLVTSEGGFSVRNLGKVDEQVSVKLVSQAPWLAKTWDVLVPSRGRVVLPFTTDVPASVGAPTFTADLYARLEGRDFAPVVKNLTFVIRDRSPPDVRILAPPATHPHSKSVLITVEAKDPVGVRDVEALVVAPTGERDLLQLPPVGGDRYTGTYAVRAPGVHTLEVRARDRAEPPHVRVLSNATFEVLAPSYAGVEPRGWGNGSVLHTRALAFNEVEEGTTRNLTVDVGLGPMLVPYPYVVEVPALNDGRHTIVVRAVGHGGGVQDRRYEITLDTRGPALGEAKVEPTGDGRLELSIRVERATAVKARVLSPSGSFDVELERGDDDAYTAHVAAPPAWSEVAFIAENGAGTESVGVKNPDAAAARAPDAGVAAVGVVLVATWVLALIRRRARD